MQKKTIRTRMKRSIALILALAMLFSETATVLADEPAYGLGGEEVATETVDVSGGDIDVSENEESSEAEEDVLFEEQLKDEEITLVSAEGYRKEFYYGIDNDSLGVYGFSYIEMSDGNIIEDNPGIWYRTQPYKSDKTGYAETDEKGYYPCGDYYQLIFIEEYGYDDEDAILVPFSVISCDNIPELNIGEEFVAPLYAAAAVGNDQYFCMELDADYSYAFSSDMGCYLEYYDAESYEMLYSGDVTYRLVTVPKRGKYYFKAYSRGSETAILTVTPHAKVKEVEIVELPYETTLYSGISNDVKDCYKMTTGMTVKLIYSDDSEELLTSGPGDFIGYSGYGFYDFELTDYYTGETVNGELDEDSGHYYYPVGKYKVRISIDGVYDEFDLYIVDSSSIDVKVVIDEETGRSNTITFSQPAIKYVKAKEGDYSSPIPVKGNYFWFEAKAGRQYLITADKTSTNFELYGEFDSYSSGGRVISPIDQKIYVSVKNEREDVSIYVDELLLPTKLEIADNSGTPEYIYEGLVYAIYQVSGTRLIATYSNGSQKEITKESDWDTSFDVVTVSMEDDKGNYTDTYDLKPGEYKLIYTIGDVSCSEPITIKGFDDVTEKLALNGAGISVEPNTTEYSRYNEKYAANSYTYAVHDYKVYKETLEPGTYSVCADTTEDVRVVVYDSEKNRINNNYWLNSWSSEFQFVVDEAGDYYFWVCVMDEGQTEPSTIYLKTEKSIKKAEIVKQPTTKFIRGFETPSIEGMSIKVTYDDGTTLTMDAWDDNWYSLVDDYAVYINGARVDWNKINLCPVGKQKWTITLVNGIKLYSEFTVVAPTITGKLNVGGSISLKTNEKRVERQRAGFTYTEYEYGTPNIVSVNLVAGQTYHFVASSEKAAWPYIQLYDPEYSSQFYLYSDSASINGFVYTAQESGTYYIIEFGRFPVTLSLERYSAIELVEVVGGPYVNTQISGLDYCAGYYGGNTDLYGVMLKITLANGEIEYVAPGDDLWYEYGITLYTYDYYNKDTGEMDYKEKNRTPGEYYMKLEIPGYNGEIERGDNLDIHVISIEDALCEAGVKSPYSYDESGMYFLSTAEKLVRVEAGKTYRISCMDTDALNIGTFDGTDVNGWIASINSYNGVPGAYNYTADEDGYILLVAGSFDCIDRTDNYVLVEEMEQGITGITVNMPDETEEIISGFTPSVDWSTITIILSYSDGSSTEIAGTDAAGYGIGANLMASDGKGGYSYPAYKYDEGGNAILPSGTYYWSFYINGINKGDLVKNHPIVVKSVASYKVNFNSNYPGGVKNSTVTQKIISNKATALKANTFKAAGYEFVGWSNEQLEVLTVGVNIPEGAAVYNDKQVVTNLSADGTAVDLYAVWRVAIYDITYHLSGGEFKDSPVGYYAYGDFVSAPTADDVNSMTGFDFAGWYMDAKYTKPATDITETTTGNIDYYAKWTPAQYTIVFNSDVSGTDTKTQTVYYGIDTALTGNRFTNKGLAFMGWAYADNKETVALADKKTINVAEIISYADENKKINLYAVWKKDFNVILNPMYGTLSDEEREFGYTYGDKVTLPTPTREGYKFAGWYTVEGVKVKSITNKTSGDLALMADWTPNTYTIKFDTNGGKGKTAAVKAEYDTEVNLTKCAFTRNGYTFAGWSTSKTGAVQYDDEAAVENLTAKSKGTVILYAVWNQDTYTISFDSMGGTEIAAKTGHIYGSNDITLPTASDVTREGYEFGGWYKDAAFKTQMKENNIKSIASDITLYAKWVAKYTVKFDGNGATSGSMKDLSCTYSTAKALTANGYKKTGFAFAGWALTPEGAAVYTNKEKISTPELNADKVLTLYAVWRNTFTINYVLNPDEYLMGNVHEYTYGTALTLPEATREGYSFAGWYTDAKLKTKASIKATTSGDLILYPKWTGLKYTVVFNMNAPEGAKTSGKMKNQSLVYGTAKVLTKNSFKATGYSFKGWATKSGGEVVFPNSAKVSDHSDELTKLYNVGDYRSTINLYAVWELDEYTVNYVMGGVVEDVTETYTVEEGGYTLISEPERPGYTFMGFYTDKKFKKKASDLKAGTTGNKTFYAKWVAYK